MEQRLRARFGESQVSREAARQALQQYGKGQRPLDEGFDAMFQFDQPVPSGLAGQADLLAEEAITRNQDTSFAFVSQATFSNTAAMPGAASSATSSPASGPRAIPMAPLSPVADSPPSPYAPAGAQAQSPPRDSRMPAKYQRAMATATNPSSTQTSTAYYLTDALLSPPASPGLTMGRPSGPSQAHGGAQRASGAGQQPVGLASRISGRPRSPAPARGVPLTGNEAEVMQAVYADRRGAGRSPGAGGQARPVSSRLYSSPGRTQAPAQQQRPQSSPSPVRRAARQPMPAWMQPPGSETPGRGAVGGVASPAPAASPSPGHSPGASPGAGPSHSGGSSPSPGRQTGWGDQGFVSSSFNRVRQSNKDNDEFFHKYRIKQHRADSPDVRFSQPRSHGPHVVVPQHVFSFDEAHPAIATEHHLRSPDQEALLQEERRLAALKKRRQVREAERLASRSKSTSPHGTPSVRQLQGDVEKLSRVRQAGRDRLRHLEEEGGQLRDTSRNVERRALDAIARAEAITRRHYRSGGRSPSMSRSPSPSPNYRRGMPPASPTRPVSAMTYEQYGVSDQRVLDEAMQAINRQGGRPTSAPGHWWASDEEASGRAHHMAPPPYAAPEYSTGLGMGVQEQDAAVQAGGETGGASASLADYIAHDSGVQQQEQFAGPALSEAEFRMASGAFDSSKYEEYNRQMDAEAEERARQRGYESDMERDRQAMEAAAREAMTDEERATAERAAAEAAQLATLLTQTWQEQNDWMDYYRQRLGPSEGYAQSSPGGSETDLQGEGHRHLVSMRSPSLGTTMEHGTGLPGSLSAQDLDMLSGPFAPVLTDELGHYLVQGYSSDGPDGYRRGRSTSSKPFSPTVPQPFSFEERAANRPKTIMKVKLEQDLELKRQEEEAAKRYRFRASPVPKQALTPKYERMMLEAEVRRQISRESRMAELAGMMEKPFSFHTRDEQAQAWKEAVAAAAKDPNRFQRTFHAKPLPGAVKGEKFKFMQLEMEAKRAAARARAEEARQRARQRVEQDTRARQDVADKMYKERLRSVDPICYQKYDTKPIGAIPDFNMLHSQWEQRMATMRALNRRHLTVPREFGTHNARDAQEKAARERKALERRQRIILDMALDAELLPEMRWPYKTPRGRVRPTPPPPMAAPDMKVSDTRANMLRRAATQKERREGRFDDPSQRERKQLERARKEAQMRAETWVALQSELASKKAMGGDMSGLAGFSAGAGTSEEHGLEAEITGGCKEDKTKKKTTQERRKELTGRTDTPAMYIEQRHKQVEKDVESMVDNALLKVGLSAYNDYKYPEG